MRNCIFQSHYAAAAAMDDDRSPIAQFVTSERANIRSSPPPPWRPDGGEDVLSGFAACANGKKAYNWKRPLLYKHYSAMLLFNYSLVPLLSVCSVLPNAFYRHETQRYSTWLGVRYQSARRRCRFVFGGIAFRVGIDLARSSFTKQISSVGKSA